MNPPKKLFRLFALFFILTILPLTTVFAANAVNISTKQDVLNVLNNILQYIYDVFFILAAIFILFSAYTFLASGGDEEKVSNAKKKFLYAVVAIVIALVSFSVSGLVTDALNGSPNEGVKTPPAPIQPNGSPGSDCSFNPNICGGDLVCQNGVCVFPGQ